MIEYWHRKRTYAMNYLQRRPESAPFSMPLLIQCARRADLGMSTQLCHCVSKDPLLDWMREWRGFVIFDGYRKVPGKQYTSYQQCRRKTSNMQRNGREESIESGGKV